MGVEGVDQASMAAAVRAGKPVELDYVDVFCDGTAVKKAGALTYPLCAALIDEFITVTNEEVAAAIRRCGTPADASPRPAGAMGLAGLLKQAEQVRGKKVLTILCGANVDFEQLAWISRSTRVSVPSAGNTTDSECRRSPADCSICSTISWKASTSSAIRN